MNTTSNLAESLESLHPQPLTIEEMAELAMLLRRAAVKLADAPPAEDQP